MMNFWDLNSLTVTELQEIIHLKKSLSLTEEEAMMRWMKENPGRIKNLGHFDGKEFESNEITKDGIKELKGSEALNKMINDVMEKKLDADSTDNS